MSKDVKETKVVEENQEDENIVTLIGEDGEEVDCYEVAFILYKNESYSVLQPVELLEGMEEDEALVFKVTAGDEDEENFELVTDDEIIDGVFAEYEKLLAEDENK